MVNQYTPTGVFIEKKPTDKAAVIYYWFFPHWHHKFVIALARVHVPITVTKTCPPEWVYEVNASVALLQGWTNSND